MKGRWFRTAAVLAGLVACGAVYAEASSVNVSINGYLPAPPGVHVYVSAGRPYYVERGRQVYLVREERRHHRKHDHDHDRGEHEGWREHGHGRHH